MIPGSLLTKRDFFITALVLIFLCITIIGFLAIQHQQTETEEEIQSELSTIAELKAGSIADWYHERRSDAEVAQKNIMLREYLENLTNPGIYKVTKEDMKAWMRSLISGYRYQSIILLESSGNQVLSVPENGTISSFTYQSIYPEIIRSESPVSTDLFLDPDSGEKKLEFWVPIRSKSGEELLGILVLQLNPEQYLYPLIQTWPSVSKSAESLITRQTNGQMLFLNDLRHLPDSGLTLTIPVTMEDVPAVMAAKGYRGIVKGNDYRGIPVVASITNITGTPWFIVAKVDQDEIYTPFRNFSMSVLGLLFLLFVCASVIVLFFRKKWETDLINLELNQQKQEIFLAGRVRSLMQQANDAIIILDDDYRILEVNDRAVEMYGYTPEEFYQKTLFDLRSDSAKRTIEDDKIKMSKSAGTFLQTEHQKKDGTLIPVENSTRLIDVNGITLRQSIIRDISERKKYETELLEKNVELQTMNEEIHASYEELASQQEELRDQMEMLRQSEIQLQEMHSRLVKAQRAGHVGLWEYYILQGKMWGTDEAYQIYGLSPSSNGMIDITSIFACIEEKDRVQSEITEVIEKGKPFNSEFRIHPADGSPDHIITSVGELQHDLHGKPHKIIGVVQDVTEKREFEEKIRHYQEKVSALFNSPVLGTMFGDIFGSVSQVNDEFLRIIGYSREDFSAGNVRWTDITPEEFLYLDEQGIAEAKESGSCTPYEKQFIRKDGLRTWVLVGYVLVGQKREDSVAFILDISRIKENEEKICHINQTLEERVHERTNQLTFINEELQSEVDERIRAEKNLQEALSILSATLESTTDGIFVTDSSGNVLLYNRMFVDMWKIPESVLRLKEENPILSELRKSIPDEQSFNERIRAIYDNPEEDSFDTLTLSDNRIFERYSKPQRIGYSIVGRVWSFRDVTKKKEMEIQIERSLREKEILLKEIHHRVKNNMQVVSSLLFMQSRLSTDEKVKEILLESQTRVKSIALVHEELYQSMDLDQIDYTRYLHKISRNIFDTYKVDTGRITITISEEKVYLNISKAVPCSLIINELISNSLKHAFPDSRKGNILIDFSLTNGEYHLVYADDGIGLCLSDSQKSPHTLGLELIQGLVKQLGGSLSIDKTKGVRYEIVFPE